MVSISKCLKNSLVTLIDLMLQIKQSTLSKVESITIQIQHLDFLAKKLQSSSTSKKDQVFFLGCLTGNGSATLTSQQETVLYCIQRTLQWI